MMWVGLTLLMLVLPVAVAVFHRLSTVKSGLALVIFMGLLGVTHHYHKLMMPWMENMITITGVLGSNELGGDRPVFFTHPIRYGVSAAVCATVSMLLASAVIWAKHPGRAMRQSVDFFLSPADSNIAVQAILITSAAYLGLELTRCIFSVAFDRHLLPLIPFAGICLFAVFQQSGLSRVPPASWAVLLVFALYAVASTQELNALGRARVVAIDRLKDAGVSDLQIDAGFEHNYWTEADNSGHINDARLVTPPNAYDKSKGPTPNLHFVYRLERLPGPPTAPTSFGQVDYFSLLPPFHRTLFIDRYSSLWKGPSTRQILPKILIDQYRK